MVLNIHVNTFFSFIFGEVLEWGGGGGGGAEIGSLGL